MAQLAMHFIRAMNWLHLQRVHVLTSFLHSSGSTERIMMRYGVLLGAFTIHFTQAMSRGYLHVCI